MHKHPSNSDCFPALFYFYTCVSLVNNCLCVEADVHSLLVPLFAPVFLICPLVHC